MTIHQAKEMLRKAGYHVDAMWHADDVMANYECDSQTALRIIQDATDTYVTDIFDTIDRIATDMNLKPTRL